MRRLALLGLLLALAGCGGREAAPLKLPPTTVPGPLAGPTEQVDVRLLTDLSDAFTPNRVTLSIDGRPIGSSAQQKEIVEGLRTKKRVVVPVIAEQGIEHTLAVRFELQGAGTGIYSYLNGYRFEVTSSRRFGPNTGTLDVIVYEQGTAQTPLEERPAIRYVERKGRRDESVITFRMAKSVVVRELDATIDGAPFFTPEQLPKVIAGLNDREPVRWAKKLGTGEHAIVVKARLADVTTEVTGERTFTFASGPGRNLEVFLGVDASTPTKQLGIVFTQVVDP